MFLLGLCFLFGISVFIYQLQKLKIHFCGPSVRAKHRITHWLYVNAHMLCESWPIGQYYELCLLLGGNHSALLAVSLYCDREQLPGSKYNALGGLALNESPCIMCSFQNGKDIM